MFPSPHSTNTLNQHTAHIIPHRKRKKETNNSTSTHFVHFVSSNTARKSRFGSVQQGGPPEEEEGPPPEEEGGGPPDEGQGGGDGPPGDTNTGGGGGDGEPCVEPDSRAELALRALKNPLVDDAIRFVNLVDNCFGGADILAITECPRLAGVLLLLLFVVVVVVCCCCCCLLFVVAVVVCCCCCCRGVVVVCFGFSLSYCSRLDAAASLHVVVTKCRVALPTARCATRSVVQG